MLGADLEKTIFSELWNFGETDLAEKNVNYNKFEIVTKQRKSNTSPTCIIFFYF